MNNSDEFDRLRAKLAEARRLLDEAQKQVPVLCVPASIAVECAHIAARGQHSAAIEFANRWAQPRYSAPVPAQPAVPDDVTKDAKTVLGMEHGQVLVLRRADTKQSAGIAALSNIGTTPYIHRLDGSKIWLGDHIHGDKFTGVFEAVAVPKVEWPDAAILSSTDSEGRKDGA